MTPPTPCSDISPMTLQLAPGLHLCWFSQTRSWSEADPFSACSVLWPRRIKHLCLVFSALHPLLFPSFSPSLSYSGLPGPTSSPSLGRAHHLHLQCYLPSPPWLTLHLSGFQSTSTITMKHSGSSRLGCPFHGFHCSTVRTFLFILKVLVYLSPFSVYDYPEDKCPCFISFCIPCTYPTA